MTGIVEKIFAQNEKILALLEAMAGEAEPVAEPVVSTLSPAVAAAVDVTSTSNFDTDDRGMPWDGRIHASTKTKTANGSWKRRKGVDKDTLAAIESELMLTLDAPDAPVSAPDAPVSAPDAPVSAPVSAPDAPDAPVSAPDAPVSAPAAPVSAPAAPVSVVAVNPDRAECVRLSNEIVQAGIPYESIIAQLQQFGADTFDSLADEHFAELRSDLEPWNDLLKSVNTAVDRITELGAGEYLHIFYGNVGTTGVADSSFDQLETVFNQMSDYIVSLEAK